MSEKSYLKYGMVSVVMPAFNVEKYIGMAIKSVLDQTYENLELIIIDDGSRDNTVGVITSFDDPRIVLVRHEGNKGIAAARNSGMKIALGEWIAPIDADDAWHPERLYKLLDAAYKFPGSFVGSGVILCLSAKDGRFLPWRNVFEECKLPSKDNIFSAKPADFCRYGLNVFPIFPRRVIVEFNINFPDEFYGHDWLYFIMKLFSVGLKYIIVDEPLYYNRIRSGSDSSTYACIESQLKTCVFLLSADWIDTETKQRIKSSINSTRHRLLTTALRERNWEKALKHVFLSPGSILYMCFKFPAWILRKVDLYRLSKKKMDS